MNGAYKGLRNIKNINPIGKHIKNKRAFRVPLTCSGSLFNFATGSVIDAACFGEDDDVPPPPPPPPLSREGFDDFASGSMST
jgi:hypothetical protein